MEEVLLYFGGLTYIGLWLLVVLLLIATCARGSGNWNSVRRMLARAVPSKSGCVLGEEVFIMIEEKVFCCFEYQSQDDARRIMREQQVPYLIVLDKQLRVAGTVWMEDFMPDDPRRRGDDQESV